MNARIRKKRSEAVWKRGRSRRQWPAYRRARAMTLAMVWFHRDALRCALREKMSKVSALLRAQLLGARP